MKVDLPAEIENVAVVTECWLYNRLAIIQASPYAEDWIASHYNVCMTEEGNILFGDLDLYLPSYHDEILQRRQIRLSSLTPRNVVATLRNNILNRRYIVMFTKRPGTANRYHEVLIYGFDDEKQEFSVVGLSSSRFGPRNLSYSDMEETIEDIKRHIFYEYDGIDITTRYHFYATAFSMQAQYITDGCAFAAYEKIDRELNGKVMQIQAPSAGEVKTLYTGIECLQGVQAMIRAELRRQEFHPAFRGIVNNVRTMYEHRMMLLLSLRYICKKWGIGESNEAFEHMREYGKCCARAEKWTNMAIKYTSSGGTGVLDRIREEIPEAEERERRCLRLFQEASFAWYMSHQELK